MHKGDTESYAGMSKGLHGTSTCALWGKLTICTEVPVRTCIRAICSRVLALAASQVRRPV